MDVADPHSIVDTVRGPHKLVAIPESVTHVWINVTRPALGQLSMWQRDVALYRRQLRELCAKVGIDPKSAVYRGRRLRGFTVPAPIRRSGPPAGWRIDAQSKLLVPYRRSNAERYDGCGGLFSTIEFYPRMSTYVVGAHDVGYTSDGRLGYYTFVDCGAAVLVHCAENIDRSPDPANGYELITPEVWAQVRQFAAEDIRAGFDTPSCT